MTHVSLERIADTLYPKEKPTDSTAYGTVASVNADGSYQVKLNASATTTRCAKLCDAEVGDRVMVVIQANGHCAAIGRVGGIGSPKVLYNDASGTDGTVTLSQSAADFDYLRIYYKKSGDSNAIASVTVYKPNGKNASLVLSNNYSGGFQFIEKIVAISGTSITKTQEGVINYSGSLSGSSSESTLYIYRVEAWNTMVPNYGGMRGGGGGDGHSYVLSGTGVTLNLTEDGGVTGNAGTYSIPEMSAQEASTGTSTAPKAISAKVLNDLIDAKMPSAIQSGSDLAVE